MKKCTVVYATTVSLFFVIRGIWAFGWLTLNVIMTPIEVLADFCLGSYVPEPSHFVQISDLPLTKTSHADD